MLAKERANLVFSFRHAIDNLSRELDVWVSCVGGRNPKPKSEVVLKKLSLPKAQAFFDAVRDELRLARDERNVYPSDELDRFVSGQPEEGGEQNWADHEIAHIAKAEELGVNLSKCSLRCYFTISGWGLKAILTFDTPKIRPVIAAEIALAPVNPTQPDLNGFKSEFKTHPKDFLRNTEILKRLLISYNHKTGKSPEEIMEVLGGKGDNK